MPYWSIYCIVCQGYIIDALLECIPSEKQRDPAFQLLFRMRPGAALACPYCGGLIGFENSGRVQPAQSSWPVFRYGHSQLMAKKLADGESSNTPLTDWALQFRFTQPGTHLPFSEYLYADDAPDHETVP
jgi:hypothetical protein